MKPKTDKRAGVKRESHNIPDDIDLQNHHAEYVKLSKSLINRSASPITETAILGLIRTAIREKWMYCDVKLAFINCKAVPDLDPNTRRRFKYQCACCKQWFTKTQVDVDHITGEHQLTSLDQVESFTRSILDVSFNDLQLLCNQTCHPIKTLAERQNISFERARILKQTIEWEKSEVDHKLECMRLGAHQNDVSNKQLRRQWYSKYLTQRG